MEGFLIPDINFYDISIIDNSMIFKPKVLNVSSNYLYELIANNLMKDCKIINCKINGKENKDFLMFKQILREIWRLTPLNILLQNTIYEFKYGFQNNNQYKFLQDINMSYKNKDFNSCLLEIVKMTELGSFNFEIVFKLADGKQLSYSKNQ